MTDSYVESPRAKGDDNVGTEGEQKKFDLKYAREDVWKTTRVRSLSVPSTKLHGGLAPGMIKFTVRKIYRTVKREHLNFSKTRFLTV